MTVGLFRLRQGSGKELARIPDLLRITLCSAPTAHHRSLSALPQTWQGLGDGGGEGKESGEVKAEAELRSLKYIKCLCI